MSPTLEPAQVTILSKSKAREQVTHLSASATGYSNQVQFTSSSGQHTVSFPAGVFGANAVTVKVGSNATPPQPVLTLVPPQPGQTEQGYPDYIDVKVQGKTRAASRTGPPIIIVRP